MGEDIRFPIGGLFSILGIILTLYGVFTGGSEMYRVSGESNVNLWTGAAMLLFGLWFLFMAWKGRKTAK